MTNPGGSSGLTPGQWGVTGTDGSVPAKATHNQSTIQTNLQDSFSSTQFSGLGGGLIGLVVSFITGAIAGILGGFVSVIEAIFGIVDNGYVAAMPVVQAQAGSIASTASAVVTTSIIDGQTVTRSSYTSGGSWSKPTPPVGKRISRIAAAAINGGNGGNGPPGVNGDGAEGGEGGGYAYQEWSDHTQVPDTVAITIGAGGNGAPVNSIGQVGGVSSFGTLLLGKPGTSNVRTSQGAVGSTCASGRGGSGGGGGQSDKYSYASTGLRGLSSALCSGGNGAAPFTAGAAGAVTATDPQILSGGAGGGGGGGSSANGGIGIGGPKSPGAGGAGAAPGGGGGGAGGGGRSADSSGFPIGGPGAHGVVAVWVYMEDI